MLKIIHHNNFKKDFKKLKKNIFEVFDNKFFLFIKNPQDITLKDHALKGILKGKRAFSITGDIRVIYKYIDKNTVILLRVGSHNQIY